MSLKEECDKVYNFDVYYRKLDTSNMIREDFYISNFLYNLEIYKNIVCEGGGKLDNYKKAAYSLDTMKIGKYFIDLCKYKNVLETINEKTKDLYLICPGYNKDFAIEIQVGLSGSRKVNEDYLSAIKRETIEEIGINISDNSFSLLSETNQLKIYGIDLDEAIYNIENFNVDYYLNNANDIRKNKVVGFIYGNLDQVLNLMKSTNLPYHFIKNENISHICTIRIDLAIQLIKLFEKDEFVCSKNKKCRKNCRLYKTY